MRRDSGIKTPEDLRGKTIAFADPVDMSGYLLPRHIFERKGLVTDPARPDGGFFKQVYFAGGDEQAMRSVLNKFVDAAGRAVAAGYEAIEVHGAHGYLLSSFMSPLANHRSDEYGGDIESRAQYPCEVVAAVRATIPEDMPLLVRVSGTDYIEGGNTVHDVAVAARLLGEAGADMIHVSSAGQTPEILPIRNVYPGYQVTLAETIRRENLQVDIHVNDYHDAAGIAVAGQGCDAVLFEVTDAVGSVKPHRGVSGCLEKRVPEENYARFQTFNDLVEREYGKRAEADMPTPLSALFRNRKMVNSFLGGRCTACGTVQFPKSVYCVNPDCGEANTQADHPTARGPAKRL